MNREQYIAALQTDNAKLEKENQQLKEDYNRVVHESTEFESQVYELQNKLQQIKKYTKNEMINDYQDNTFEKIQQSILEIVGNNATD